MCWPHLILVACLSLSWRADSAESISTGIAKAGDLSPSELATKSKEDEQARERERIIQERKLLDRARDEQEKQRIKDKEAEKQEMERRARVEFDNQLASLKTEVQAAKSLESAAWWTEQLKARLFQQVSEQARPSLTALYNDLASEIRPVPLRLPDLERFQWTFVQAGLNWVTYKRGKIEMSFRAIQLVPGGERMAIATCEMPVELAIQTGALTHAPGDGPRTWVNGSPTGGHLWPGCSETLRYLESTYLKRGSMPKFLAPGLNDPPHATAPLNFVTPAQAASIAARLGGRLPPYALWRKALNLAEKSNWNKAPRLRGTAFRRQVGYLSDLNTAAVANLRKMETEIPVGMRSPPLPHGPLHWPDTGSYAQGAGSGPYGGDQVWFSQVDRESRLHPDRICDLIGNVAEYVVGSREEVIIVGGSAISKLEAVSAEVPPTPNSRNGYSDVGFRLAVQVPGRADDQLVAFKRRIAAYTVPKPMTLTNSPESSSDTAVAN